MNIIGLGQAGCRLASSFEEYPQYNVFFIDSEQHDNYKNLINVPKQETHEDYEKKYKSLNLRKVKGDTTLIVVGISKISGIALRVLQQLKNRRLSVLYVKPDMSTCTEEQVLIERLNFGVLQQYARSSMLSEFFVISNEQVEKVLDSVSITNYWQDMNKIISSTYHMLNVFNNTEPILTNLAEPVKSCKIKTVGVVGFESLNEKLFYNLENTRMKKYFFGISQETLNEEKDLLHKIRSYVKEKANQEEKCTSCFAIYLTSYKQNYVYTTHYASFIQEENLIDD